MPPKANTVRGHSPRHHIVLVPGFAGFDALGQLEYYAGVTPQFRIWQPNHPDAVLHYFDNFPTAAVSTRAGRLRRYLAKRVLRGEFGPEDTVALVGHSTGGLDIRRLLWDLADDKALPFQYDGVRDPKLTPKAEELLAKIRRVVFLSVPQWGTNIADWIHNHGLARRIIVGELWAGTEASQIPFLGKLEECLSNSAAWSTGLDLLYAVEDALNEAETCPRGDPTRTAMAQEAGSELTLWLRHIATDFGAIDDLTACVRDGQNGKPESPAHFDTDEREKEKKIWKANNITIQSYATIGRRPFRFNGKSSAPTWDLLNPCAYPECAKDNTLSAGTDIVYRTLYRACAGGPFRSPNESSVPVPFLFTRKHEIAVWDNDGIVNTASMLWPKEGQVLLVEADHMDIVGHYRRVLAPPGNGRTYEAYDLFRSNSGFDEQSFAKVWNSVFDFCV